MLHADPVDLVHAEQQLPGQLWCTTTRGGQYQMGRQTDRQTDRARYRGRHTDSQTVPDRHTVKTVQVGTRQDRQTENGQCECQIQMADFQNTNLTLFLTLGKDMAGTVPAQLKPSCSDMMLILCSVLSITLTEAKHNQTSTCETLIHCGTFTRLHGAL